MQKKKTVLIAIAMIVIVAVVVFAFVIPMAVGAKSRIAYGTFTDIKEVEDYFRTHYKIDTQNVADKRLGKLQPVESFACEFQSEGVFYKIYSYVFADTDDAKTYFKNHTGISAEGLSENFSLSSNTYFSTELTSYRDRNAWHIDGGSLVTFNKMYDILLANHLVELTE